MEEVPTVKLSNGHEMPILGFGVFQMSNEEAEQSVVDAIETGYRSIDTAASYHNEEAVGRGSTRSGIGREEIFVTSKLWIADASYEAAKKAYQTSLDKLGPMPRPVSPAPAIRRRVWCLAGADSLYESGKVKAIGVSNFSAAKLTNFILTNQRVLGVDTVPSVNQVETNPFNQEVRLGWSWSSSASSTKVGHRSPRAITASSPTPS